nr:uncharacterized protein LOC124490765 [Dermatophagoides farinae]
MAKNIKDLINTIHHVNTNNEHVEQIWQLWRWKPPVQSSLQTRDDYFHNPASTPHTIMNEFKKHLTVSKDLKFHTCDLRRLAEIEYQPLMTFVTQDDYDDHTDSMVRSYFIFKDGVMPLWEDEYNVFGGCWSLIWSNDFVREKSHENDQHHHHHHHHHHQNHHHNHGSKKTSKFIWKQVINLLTDPLMVKYVDEISGVGLTIRSNKTYKITIWNRNSDDTITKMMIGQNIKSILGHSGPMFYYSHKSTLKNQYAKKKQEKTRQRRTTLPVDKNSMNVDDSPRLNPNRSSGFSQRFSSNHQIHSITADRSFPMMNYRSSSFHHQQQSPGENVCIPSTSRMANHLNRQNFHHVNPLVY